LAAIDVEVILGHPASGEAFFKDPSDAGAIELVQALGGALPCSSLSTIKPVIRRR
jgi:hypothetical protein